MLDKASPDQTDMNALMLDIGRRARAAARPLAIATTEAKNAALTAMADAILADERSILAANATDLKNAEDSALAPSFIDRLTLDPARIAAIADGIRGRTEGSGRRGDRRLGPAERP